MGVEPRRYAFEGLSRQRRRLTQRAPQPGTGGDGALWIRGFTTNLPYLDGVQTRFSEYFEPGAHRGAAGASSVRASHPTRSHLIVVSSDGSLREGFEVTNGHTNRRTPPVHREHFPTLAQRNSRRRLTELEHRDPAASSRSKPFQMFGAYAERGIRSRRLPDRKAFTVSGRANHGGTIRRSSTAVSTIPGTPAL